MMPKQYLMELIGTYLYVLMNLYTRNGIIIGLSIALIIIFGARVFLHKGDYNPMITLAMLLDGRITAVGLLYKWGNQFLAVILAFLTYKILV